MFFFSHCSTLKSISYGFLHQIENTIYRERKKTNIKRRRNEEDIPFIFELYSIFSLHYLSLFFSLFFAFHLFTYLFNLSISIALSISLYLSIYLSTYLTSYLYITVWFLVGSPSYLEFLCLSLCVRCALCTFINHIACECVFFWLAYSSYQRYAHCTRFVEAHKWLGRNASANIRQSCLIPIQIWSGCF